MKTCIHLMGVIFDLQVEQKRWSCFQSGMIHEKSILNHKTLTHYEKIAFSRVLNKYKLLEMIYIVMGILIRLGFHFRNIVQLNV